MLGPVNRHACPEMAGLVFWAPTDARTPTRDVMSAAGNYASFSGNAFWGTSPQGGAYYFDGSGDYVRFADAPIMRSNAPMTIAFWLKVDSSATVVCFEKGNDQANDVDWGFGLQGDLRSAWIMGNNFRYGTNYVTALGEWIHYAIRRAPSGSNAVYSYAINGANVAPYYLDSFPGVLDYGSATTGPLTLGARGSVDGAYLNGAIGNFRVWNIALPDALFRQLNSPASHARMNNARDPQLRAGLAPPPPPPPTMVWDAPMSLTPSVPKDRARRTFTAVRGELGDIVRPDAADPLPSEKPVWHTALSEPPRPAQKDRRHTAQSFAFGMPIAAIPEAVTLDRFASETRLPPRRAVRAVLTSDYAIDPLHLLDVEHVESSAFVVPLALVVPARKPAPRIPGTDEKLREIWPDDPVVREGTWHVPLAQPPMAIKARGPRGQVSWEELTLHPDQVFEFTAINWHTPLEIPRLDRLPRTPPLPSGDMDTDDLLRIEILFTAAYLVEMMPPVVRRRLRQELSGTELGSLPEHLIEAIHAEVLQRQEIAVPRRLLHAFVVALQDGSLLEEGGFESPAILRLNRDMLAAGFWRARM